MSKLHSGKDQEVQEWAFCRTQFPQTYLLQGVCFVSLSLFFLVILTLYTPLISFSCFACQFKHNSETRALSKLWGRDCTGFSASGRGTARLSCGRGTFCRRSRPPTSLLTTVPFGVGGPRSPSTAASCWLGLPEDSRCRAATRAGPLWRLTGCHLVGGTSLCTVLCPLHGFCCNLSSIPGHRRKGSPRCPSPSLPADVASVGVGLAKAGPRRLEESLQDRLSCSRLPKFDS